MKENIGSLYLPPVAGADAAAHDQLFDFILYLSTFFFLLIVGMIVVFVIKYRRRTENQRTSPIEGNQKLEIVWSVIPAILLVVMFVWGFKGWMAMNVAPAEAIDIRVLGKKWNWEFDYPKDGIQAATELVVPINKPVKLTMSSVDVLHSFYIPAFRTKRDVLPNRYSVLWFEATQLGTFDVYCAEYCGTSHSQMITRVKVVSDQEYKAFLEGGGGMENLPPLELGKKLFSGRGCNACHSVTAERKGLPGPPLGGKFGTMEKLKEGPDVKIDENYLRESILEPNAKIVAGYEPVMPTFKGRLKDRQLNALIDYIKSLK
jgi:cytochrome c oxidase subunit II